MYVLQLEVCVCRHIIQMCALENKMATTTSVLYLAEQEKIKTENVFCDHLVHHSTVSCPYLSFGWQSFNLLDEEGVWLDHDDERYASRLLHAAHQAWVVHDLRPLAQSRRHLTAAAIRAKEGRKETELARPGTRYISQTRYSGREVRRMFMLPFDVDGEEPLHFSGAAAHCGSERLSLAVAEEKHLKHMGVIGGHTTAGYLPVAILESHGKNLPQYCFPPFSIFKKTQIQI